MKDYKCSVVIAASAAVVYDALTTVQGLRGWWTPTCDVGRSVGAQSTFRFGQTHHVMRIERLHPTIDVRWRCVEQHDHTPGQLTCTDDEWGGTTLVFHLISRSLTSTLLEFEHIGLSPRLACYQIGERDWNHFLKRSLKQYAETGRGQPYVESTA